MPESLKMQRVKCNLKINNSKNPTKNKTIKSQKRDNQKLTALLLARYATFIEHYFLGNAIIVSSATIITWTYLDKVQIP